MRPVTSDGAACLSLGDEAAGAQFLPVAATLISDVSTVNTAFRRGAQ